VPDGGTAVIIKNSIKHYELQKYGSQHLQASSIALEDWQGPLTIAAVYCPPRPTVSKAQFEDFYRTLEVDLLLWVTTTPNTRVGVLG
jgi:hypothetical protein